MELNYKKIGFLLSLSVVTIAFILLKNGDNWSYKLQPINEGDKIVAFGDSLTYGYQLPRESSYPHLLNEELGYKYKVVNYGVNGNTTNDGLRRFEEMLEDEKPSLVILGLGGNDILRRISAQTSIDNLVKMIEMAKINNSQVVLLPNPEPSVKGYFLGYKDYYIFKDVSEKTQTPMISNAYSKWLSKDNYKIDKIHLNKEGYYEVAKEIKKQFIKNRIINE